MIVQVFFVIFLLVVSPAFAGGLPNCSIHKESNIAFSSDDQLDVLLVSIEGAPCAKANLTIAIKNSNDDVIYSYQAPFKRHVAVHGNDSYLDRDALAFVDEVFAERQFSDTSQLPRWESKLEYWETNYQEIKISKSYYESLRNLNFPTFSHIIHYEGWRVLTYDTKRKEVIVVSEGGV